jgi:hypothetical protein
MAENSCFVVNELLTYVKCYRNSSNNLNLKKVLTSFYTAEVISAAKACLLSTFACLAGSSYAVARRGSSARPQHDAEVDDILAGMDYIDNKDAFGNCQFVAVNVENLPKYGPEEINICSVVDRQISSDKIVDTLKGRVDSLEAAVSGSIVGNSTPVLTDLLEALDSKMSAAMASLSDRIDNTNVNLATYAKIADSVRGPPRSSQVEADCAMNVVFHGVPEDRDSSQWRTKVESIVQFLAGRPVEISDMLRIGGRFQVGRTRPVLLKLRSVWDRRILLSARPKLKDYSIAGNNDARVYIHPDEPLDARRKQTFDRLKRKAESDGSLVTILNDTLFIDGVAVFSVQSGYIKAS